MALLTDDDQHFVHEVGEFIKDHETVDYETFKVDSLTDEGRDAVFTVTLYAGDRYRITLEELHD